jgi:hypothetical protein
MVRFTHSRLLSVLLVVALPLVAFGQDPIGKVRGGGSSIDWQLKTHGHAAVELTVLMPNGDVLSRTFKNGNPSLRIQDLGTDIEEGVYNYELRLVPRVPSDVAKKLENARAANDEAAARKIMRDAGLLPVTQSGAFMIQNGSIVDPDRIEEGATTSLRDDSAPTLGTGAAGPGPGKVTVNDQVIPDDLIVQGSGCFGLDCVNNESFGFDTIRMKENNLRIKAEDTSSSSGFPASDWQLTFNDSASGGSNKFSVEDITGARVPFTVEGGSPTNSLFVDSTGNIGLQTSTPALDFHINSTDTPAHRFEQNNSGGFTAQTWDVGANEANFFVRDVTGGSLLSFRIRPGAPTSSIDISSDGDVGIGTASPNAVAQMDVSDTSTGRARLAFTGQEFFAASNTSAEGVALLLGVNRTNDRQFWIADTSLLASNATNPVIRFRPNNGNISAISTNGTSLNLSLQESGGNVGIGCLTPTSDLVIASNGGCANPSSSINAGSAQFTVASSRTFKENIEPLRAGDILSKIEKIDVYKYDFKEGPKDRVGLIAEDFHQVFERGDEKYIDGSEVQLALWMAVQELTKQNKELKERLNKLEEATKPQQ